MLLILYKLKISGIKTFNFGLIFFITSLNSLRSTFLKKENIFDGALKLTEFFPSCKNDYKIR